MTDLDTERDPLEALASEFVERQRRGKCPSISEYAAKHPELADEIRELFPTITAVERLKVHKEKTSNGRASLGAIRLERLGDFRILREIGRGGMGIVFEAVQESLGRRVAIKILPRQSLLDPKTLTRFKREAGIAARLHHSNIIPIFGVGEDEGFHYYVMQFIYGVGLDRVISWLAQKSPNALKNRQAGTGKATEKEIEDSREINSIVQHLFGGHSERPSASAFRLKPIYWRSVARIGLQIANALHYAHMQGTMHRDIKPANLLVDAQGIVWIADFGLAKAMQSDEIGHTGGLSGTLHYMAPEQFQGQADARSDIYSFGLTLYELLTLHPAYDKRSRTELIHCTIQGQPIRPRKLLPQIPKDLETIILRAISRDPDHRYQTAENMATDLQCFLEDRPIQARRANSIELLWRWCRRNRAVATLAGTTLLLIVFTAIVATVGYVSTKKALDGEARERKNAEANAGLAIEALDRIFERFSPSGIPTVSELTIEGAERTSIEVPSPPVLSKEAAILLEDMLTFYDRLAKQVGDEDTFRQKVADANRRVGDIRQRLGQYDQAIPVYQRAIEIYQDLSRREPESVKFKTEIARTQNSLGRLYLFTSQMAEARQSHLEALSIFQSMQPKSSAVPEIQYELARTHYFLGTGIRPEPGLEPRGPEPSRPLHRGREPWPPSHDAPLPPPLDPHPQGKEELAIAGNRCNEEEHVEKAISLLNDLVEKDPSNSSYQLLLALCYRDFFLKRLPHDPGFAFNALNRATEILERLVQESPEIADYSYDLCETYAIFDTHRPIPPPFTDSLIEERLRKAFTISEKLVTEHPYIPHYGISQAHVLHHLGILMEHTDRLGEAGQSHQRAVEIYQSLIRQFPEISSYKVWLAAFRGTLANVMRQCGQFEKARNLLEDTIALLNDLLEKEPEMWFIHGLLAKCHNQLAEVLDSSGEEDLANQAARQAKKHCREMRSKRREFLDAGRRARKK